MTAQNSKLFGSKASRHLLDGAMVVVPGYDGTSTDRAEQYSGDEFPFVIPASIVTASSVEVSSGDTRMIPFNAKLVAVSVIITTSGVVTDGLKVNVGTASDHGLFVSGYKVTGSAGTLINIPMATDSVKSRTIVAGNTLNFAAVSFSTDAGVGSVAITAVVAPRL